MPTVIYYADVKSSMKQKNVLTLLIIRIVLTCPVFVDRKNIEEVLI